MTFENKSVKFILNYIIQLKKKSHLTVSVGVGKTFFPTESNFISDWGGRKHSVN